MRSLKHTAPSLGLAFLLLSCILLGGCLNQQKRSKPKIEFSKIPPAAQGGRERVDTVAGRVSGSRPGEKIVLYARSGPWWLQPWPDKPFIPIQSDSTWGTSTHLGYEYAVLLVDAGYEPPPTMDTEPSEGGSVLAVKVVKGVGETQFAPTKPLHFSGYDWEVRTIASDHGGLNNLYDADNAWTDGTGALHLRVTKRAERWACAELTLTRSLGYGTYTVTVRDISRLEPAAVLSMVTYDDWGADQHYRELETEISKWGDAENKTNAQYGISPFYIPGNIAQFMAPPGRLTSSMQWESGRVSFKTVRGASVHAGAPVVFQHVFSSGVPSPGQERVELFLYVVASSKHPLKEGAEVVVEKFEYLP